MDLSIAITQFNQQEFYDCHDTLEEIWHNASHDDRNFYQGILQIAVACHHLSRDNKNGAMILLGEGLKRLREYRPSYYQVDLDSLCQESYNLLSSLQTNSYNSSIPLPIIKIV